MPGLKTKSLVHPNMQYSHAITNALHYKKIVATPDSIGHSHTTAKMKDWYIISLLILYEAHELSSYA